MAIIWGFKRRFIVIALGAALAIIFFIVKEFSYNNSETETAASFLAKVMASSGGKANYQNIKQLRFTKSFHLYAQDGVIELDREEKHSYDFTKGTHRTIQWTNDKDDYTIIQKDTLFRQIKNGIIDRTQTKEQLELKMNAATFVLGLPYTLDTPTAQTSYQGLKDFEGVQAHELKVRFKGSPDVWTLYYEQERLKWLGYWVQTSDHYSLVINDEMTRVSGFLLSQKRKSYRTDAQKKRLYLRADYEYTDFQID